MTIYEKLLKIQTELKCPKSQYNSFGKYNYRSCEDILEAVKPLCLKYKAVVFLTDQLVQVGERYYVEAEATFCDLETEQNLLARGYAREDETKKGMDGSQITGASSSYARKYALNGLFDIDDNQDSDSTNIQPVETSKPVKPARERLIAKLHEKGIDINTYAKEHNLTSQSTTEDFERLLAELEG